MAHQAKGLFQIRNRGWMKKEEERGKGSPQGNGERAIEDEVKTVSWGVEAKGAEGVRIMPLGI